MNIKILFLLITISLVTFSCIKDDGPGTNSFGDTFPVKFLYDTMTNVSESRIYLSDGRDLPYSLQERENEMASNLYVGRNQIQSLELLNLKKADLRGKHKDGLTEALYETEYSNTGDNFTFVVDVFFDKLQYTSFRQKDTMIFEGLTCLRYNNGVRQSRSTTVEVNGFTLEDEKNKVMGNDTLYYKTFEIRLAKESQ